MALPDAKRMPIRKVGEYWEVLSVQTGKDGAWVKCASEKDARILSLAPLVEQEYLDVDAGKKMKKNLPDRLESTAEVLERYKMRAGARFFRRYAGNLRKK